MNYLYSLLLFALLFAGCRQAPKNHYSEALTALERGDEATARICLLQEIAVNDTPGAHLRYADLCAVNESEAILAAWHYRRYMELAPNNSDIADVSQKATACETRYLNRYIRDVTGREYSSIAEILDRMKLIEEQSSRQKNWREQLENENKSLTRQLLDLRQAKLKDLQKNGK